jgi:hypothetical protein
LETESVFVVADVEMLQLTEEEAVSEEENIYRNMNTQNELWRRRRRRKRDAERNLISCTNSCAVRGGLQETSAIVFTNRTSD